MINATTDELLSLSQASKACPALDGKKPHLSTIWRWMRIGIRGVKLEYVRIGRRICTTRAALDEFFRLTAEAPTPQKTYESSPQSRTPKQKERDLAAARADLADMGVKIGTGN